MSRIIRSSHKKIERKRKLIIAAVIFSVLLLIGFGTLVWFATYPAFQIKDVEVRGNEMFSGDDVAQAIKADLSGKTLYLFPRSSVFLYSKNDIREHIRTVFPKWKNVSLFVNEKQILIVSLSERIPAALWCGVSVPEEGKNDTCHYIDDSGFIFGRAPTFSGDAYFKFYGAGVVRIDKPIGSTFLSAELFRKILDLRGLLAQYDKTIASVFWGESETLEFFSNEGCKMLFDAETPLDSLKTNIEAIFSSSKWGVENKSDGTISCEGLDYIDFRFGNKIYYKKKGPGSAIDPLAPSAPKATSTPSLNATSTAISNTGERA